MLDKIFGPRRSGYDRAWRLDGWTAPAAAQFYRDLTLTIDGVSDRGWQASQMREYRHRAILYLIVAGTFVMLSGAITFTLAQQKGPSSGGAPERNPGITDPLVAAISRWDADHDGVLTCEEWKQYADRLFTLADKNADGVLDGKEFQQIGNMEPVFAGADMAYFDDNNDKRISRSEFVDKPNPLFARYDANRDCRVTEEEIKGSASPTSGKGAAPRRRSGRGGAASQSGF